MPVGQIAVPLLPTSSPGEAAEFHPPGLDELPDFVAPAPEGGRVSLLGQPEPLQQLEKPPGPVYFELRKLLAWRPPPDSLRQYWPDPLNPVRWNEDHCRHCSRFWDREVIRHWQPHIRSRSPASGRRLTVHAVPLPVRE